MAGRRTLSGYDRRFSPSEGSREPRAVSTSMSKPTSNDAGNPRPRIVLKINSNPANLRSARHEIEAFCLESGFDDKASGDVGLCLNEAIANVMRHAYEGKQDQPILIEAECDGEELSITIRDWGTPFDPSALPEKKRDPLQPGGVGLICMKELLDEFHFAPQVQGTLLRMIKRK
jgi:serine/threonine-protein kinase RsbW